MQRPRTLKLILLKKPIKDDEAEQVSSDDNKIQDELPLVDDILPLSDDGEAEENDIEPSSKYLPPKDDQEER